MYIYTSSNNVFSFSIIIVQYIYLCDHTQMYYECEYSNIM